VTFCFFTTASEISVVLSDIFLLAHCCYSCQLQTNPFQAHVENLRLKTVGADIKNLHIAKSK